MRLRPLVALAVLLTTVLPASGSATAQAVPLSFARLLPAGASLDASAGEWEAIETSVMGGLRAKFPGLPRNCFRTESQVDIELKAESSIPLDMVRELAQEEIEQSTAGLTREAQQRASKTGTGSLDVVAVGKVTQEKLATGLLVHYEYTENCANRVNAKVAIVDGHASRGTMILLFRLAMNTGLADARAKAVEILDKFATFDMEAAKRGK